MEAWGAGIGSAGGSKPGSKREDSNRGAPLVAKNFSSSTDFLQQIELRPVRKEKKLVS